MPDGIYQQYKPAPVPIETNPELSRYLDDELNRISELTERRTAPVKFAVSGSVLDVALHPPPVTWSQMYVTATPEWELPECWDAGTFTAPYTGQYMVNTTLQTDNPLGTGNARWNAWLSYLKNGTDRAQVTQGAPDDVEINLALTAPYLLAAGDTITIWADLTHESRTNLVNAAGYTSITRV